MALLSPLARGGSMGLPLPFPLARGGGISFAQFSVYIKAPRVCQTQARGAFYSLWVSCGMDTVRQRFLPCRMGESGL